MGKGHGIARAFFLFIFLVYYQQIQTCSPPRTKFGDQTIREMSVLKRSDKAEVIVLGSVVETDSDKYGHSLSVRVAVHMVLKSKTRLKKYIKISGFDVNAKQHSNKLFVNQASMDCVSSEVQLYGSYIFFVRENQYGDYYVDELNLQPAVTEIPCKPQLSKRVKRLIIKYRKMKKNKSQCNDFARSSSSVSRKCLKHRSFWRMLNEFKYKMLPIRKFFCSVRRSTFKKTLPAVGEEAMRDDIIPRKINHFKIPSYINNQNKDKSASIASNRGNNIIMYSKSENYIVQENSGDVSSSNGGSSANRRLIPDWRFFHHQYQQRNTNSASARSVRTDFCLSLLTIVMSLIYSCL